MAPVTRKGGRSVILDDRPKKEVVWIYGETKFQPFPGLRLGPQDFLQDYFEFHPKLQDHIEAMYKSKKKTCRVYVSGHTWLIDFKIMRKTDENTGYFVPVKRLPRSKVTNKLVVGVNGVRKFRQRGYKQNDDTCNICLYKATIPTRIDDCGHEFCFMCIKSNYMMGMECPTCRKEIPSELFDCPISNDLDIHMECPAEYAADCVASFSKIKVGTTLGTSDPTPTSSAAPFGIRRSERLSSRKYYWIYQSHSNGYFRYDPKTEKYLEESFIRKKQKATIFICGQELVVNFTSWKQYRPPEDPTVSRNVKRILASEIDKHQIKGIAGVRGYVRVIE